MSRKNTVRAGTARPQLATAPTRRQAGGVTTVKGDRARQWQRGQLNAAVKVALAGWFADRPDHEGLSASDVTRLINLARKHDTDPIAQAGAVKYALLRLQEAGWAELAGSSPFVWRMRPAEAAA